MNKLIGKEKTFAPKLKRPLQYLDSLDCVKHVMLGNLEQTTDSPTKVEVKIKQRTPQGIILSAHSSEGCTEIYVLTKLGNTAAELIEKKFEGK